MNKRQKKKRRGKYLPVIADEVNLILMSDDERERAIADYMKYVEKYAYRKHYKDLRYKVLNYYYPPPAKAIETLRKMALLSAGKSSSKPVTVSQSLGDLYIR